MYARIQQGDGGTSGQVLRRVAGTDALVVTLWQTEAEAAADPTAEWYEVLAEHGGPDRDATPSVVAVIHFDGPLSPDLVAASAKADRRIAPVMAEHPGAVRVLVLWQPQRRSRVLLSYATSIESLEQGQQKIKSMDLWEDEDAALLPGPDRVDLYRVSALTAEVMA